MSKSRFPKAAYVRRLELLYAELGEWQDSYGLSIQWTNDRDVGARLEERNAVLREAQQRIMRVITILHELPRVS